MKNKNLKVIGLIGLAVIGMFALNRLYNQKPAKEIVDNGLAEVRMLQMFTSMMVKSTLNKLWDL